MLVLMIAGCAAPPARTGQVSGGETGQPQSSGPKRIVVAIAGDLPVLNTKVIRAVYAYTAPGGIEVEDLITDGLADLDDDNVPQAKLAEAVPSLENGLWKLHPDGRM